MILLVASSESFNKEVTQANNGILFPARKQRFRKWRFPSPQMFLEIHLTHRNMTRKTKPCHRKLYTAKTRISSLELEKTSFLFGGNLLIPKLSRSSFNPPNILSHNRKLSKHAVTFDVALFRRSTRLLEAVSWTPIIR